MSPLWRFAVAALVALALPLQALEMAWARASGPAHVHVSLTSALGEALRASHGHHDHAGIGHHHHPVADPAAASAVWLDDSHGADPTRDAAAHKKPRSVIDNDTLHRAVQLQPPQVALVPVPAAGSTTFTSHVVEPPVRPPRRA